MVKLYLSALHYIQSHVIDSMKALLFLLFFPTIVLSQDIFSFPEELLVDPYRYEMKALKINRIEQYHTDYWRRNGGFSQFDTSFTFDYIVEYDSLRRVSSFKYDFEKEYGGSVMSSPNGPITIFAYNDSSRMQRVIGPTDTTYYNYYENVFHYGIFNQLEDIEVIRPIRTIIDGVYIKEHPREHVRIEEDYMEDLLIKRTYFADDVLVYTQNFEYQTFEYGEKPIHLLHMVTSSYGTQITVHFINYYR